MTASLSQSVRLFQTLRFLVGETDRAEKRSLKNVISQFLEKSFAKEMILARRVHACKHSKRGKLKMIVLITQQALVQFYTEQNLFNYFAFQQAPKKTLTNNI